MARTSGSGGATAPADTTTPKKTVSPAGRKRPARSGGTGKVRVKGHTRKAPAKKGGKPSRYHYGLRAGYTKADLNSPGALVGSPTLGQAIAAANAQAGAQFNPTINSLRTRLGGLQPWFANYRAQVQAAQGMSNAVAAPQIAQAQQFAQQTGQPLGLQGPAGGTDAIAAAGRTALTMLGAQTLQGIQQANNNYFSAQQAQVAPQQFQATTDLNTQLGQARQQRSAAASSALNSIRAQAQNNQIANATLGLNTAKAQAAEQDKAASRKVTVRGQNLSAAARRRQQGLTARGQDLTHQDRAAARQAAQQRQQAAAQKKTIQAKRKFQHKVNDAADRWQTLSNHTNTVTHYDQNLGKYVPTVGKNGKPVTRKPTPDEVRAQMQKEGYTSAQINAALRLLRRKRRQGENRSVGLAVGRSHGLAPGAPGQGARPT